MKYIKRILFVFLFAFLILGVSKVEAKGKVKVYIFEAGGCPYCEAEIEYLKGLDSYNKKFEIVKKELYVDHIDWQPGKDYELGKKVADSFNAVGFTNATYQATPFVVISDLYAVSSYTESLENVINQAYEEGDKDIVSCIEKGNTDCLAHIKVEDTTETGTKKDNNLEVILLCVTIVLLIINIVLTYIGIKCKEPAKKVSISKEETLVHEEKKKPKKTNKK
jgi:hypothetical protein